MAHFDIDIRWIGDRVHNFGAQKLPVALPEPMYRHLHRAISHSEPRGGLASGRFITRKAPFERLEQLALASIGTGLMRSRVSSTTA